MASKHTKRSFVFANEMMDLARKLMGKHDKADLMKAANILIERTTDSACVVKALNHEPIFVMLGHDRCAVAGLTAWINEAERLGLHGDKLDDAKECLKEFTTYQP